MLLRLLLIIAAANGVEAFLSTLTQTQPNQKRIHQPLFQSSSVVEQDSTSPVFRRARTFCVTGVTKRDGPLNEAVVQVLNDHFDSETNNNPTTETETTLQEANEWIAMGAVWARMDALTEDELLALYNTDDDDDGDIAGSSRATYADLSGLGQQRDNGKDADEAEEDLDRYLEQMEQQRFKRILSPSWIEAGTDVRIYPNPRRFTEACTQMTRQNGSLLYEDTTFVVVDKPPMLPTQPHSSNYYECCPGCAQTNLGPFYDISGREIDRPLLCHRVDACVGGCVVLSKDRNGQRVFHELQRQRKLRKVYLAVTQQPVPLGMHLHWMWAPQTARGNVGGPPCQLVSLAPPESRRKARDFWNRCILEVVKSEPIAIDPKLLASYPESEQQEQKVFYQTTIRLVTGRKHQVRAQLAALGCPILGDSLYQPMAGLTLDRLDDSEDAIDEAVARGRVPTQPIGLQAHAISFGGIRAKANPPWWGTSVVEEATRPANSS